MAKRKLSASSRHDVPASVKELLITAGETEIDFSDMPELTDAQLDEVAAQRQRQERQVKRKKTKAKGGRPPLGRAARVPQLLRIDPDVLAWLRQKARNQGRPFNSFLNDVLAKAMRKSA